MVRESAMALFYYRKERISMAKYYRGDTLPFVVSYEGYRFQPGDVVTGSIFTKPESDEDDLGEALITVEVNVLQAGDEVQLEFSREQMHDIADEVIVEARTVTNGNVEMTVQKELDLGRDGIR